MDAMGSDPSKSLLASQRMWPTPDAGVFGLSVDLEKNEARRERIKATGINGNGFGHPLAVAVRMWPTPTRSDGMGGPNGGRDGGENLRTAVQMFPTPGANDWKGSSKDGQRRGQLTDPAMGAIPAGGQLNPTWVEWLMGFPPGWTDCEHLATPSFRRSLKSSGGD
jgi:hypothetical protein